MRRRELLDMGVFEETPSLEERRKRVDTNVAWDQAEPNKPFKRACKQGHAFTITDVPSPFRVFLCRLWPVWIPRSEPEQNGRKTKIQSRTKKNKQESNRVTKKHTWSKRTKLIPNIHPIAREYRFKLKPLHGVERHVVARHCVEPACGREWDPVLCSR